MTAMVGGLLLVVGGGLGGYSITRGMAVRIGAISAIIEVLYAFEREISLHLTPLPALLRGEFRQFSAEFQRCGRALEDGIPLRSCWGRLVNELPIGGEERAMLRPLGDILGRYEGDVQRDALLRTAHDLTALQDRLRTEQCRLGRVYPVVGLTVGAFVGILLL